MCVCVHTRNDVYCVLACVSVRGDVCACVCMDALTDRSCSCVHTSHTFDHYMFCYSSLQDALMVDCMCVWLYATLGSKVMEKAIAVLGSNELVN